MARVIGVKHTYLIKDGCEAWEFLDDYRPALSIDQRYAKYDQFGGMIWYTDTKRFDSAEEGNSFYQKLLKDGFKRCTEGEVRKLRGLAADMTY